MAQQVTRLRSRDKLVSKLHVRLLSASFVMINHQDFMATMNFDDTLNDITVKLGAYGCAAMPLKVAYSCSTAKLVVQVRLTAPTTTPLLTYDELISIHARTREVVEARNPKVVAVWVVAAGLQWIS